MANALIIATSKLIVLRMRLSSEIASSEIANTTAMRIIAEILRMDIVFIMEGEWFKWILERDHIEWL